jgi:restriction system protein
LPNDKAKKTKMSIPDFQTIMLPLLKHCAQNLTEISTNRAIDALAQHFKLTEQELQELLPSGNQFTFTNRVGWAATYLKKAKLLEPTRRGYFKITARGQELVANNPSKINIKFLQQYPEFLEFQNLRGTRKHNEKIIDNDSNNEITPSEALEEAYQTLRNEIAEELLEKIKGVSPSFFEKLVVELLVKMGYGGSRIDAGKAIGKTNDGGIDGIIKEDKLGLDVIYIQAKRWNNNSIGRPEVQQFSGALQGQHANKGIFITTSNFTQQAREFVSQIGSKIVLIDGNQLAQLMIDYDVGVSVISVYQVKKIDSDYFE